MITDNLYIIAEQEGIEMIYDFPLPENKSMSADINGIQYIGIDHRIMETSAEERVHLAHEIGHCQTGAFYSIYSPIDNRQWCENKANIRAFSLLIPEDDLMEVIISSDYQIEYWELSEHFNVTEDFMINALKYYFDVV